MYDTKHRIRMVSKPPYVPSSHLGPKIGYPEHFRAFPQSRQVNAVIVP
jgi:hypothetical protein